MRPTAMLLALPLILALPVAAQAPMTVPGAADVTRVTAGTYAADPGHTLVQWKVNHFGFNDYMGLFGDVTGTLVLDPANPAAAKVDMTIPVSKVTTASAGLTGHLLKPGADGKAPDFFGAAPADARFVSTGVHVMEDGKSAHIMGNLTLNGQTHPVTLGAVFAGAGANPFSKKETVGFHATGTIKRSQFGIGYGVPIVSDDVRLDITVAFEKQ